MFLQFEDHARDLLAREPAPETVTARDRFSYLPPAGLLPVRGPVLARGFDLATFFADLASADVALIDAGSLRALLHEAASYEPTDLGQVGRLQLYLIYENLKAQEAGGAVGLAAVFASPELRYRGRARFGYGRWSLSRFAPRVI
jgi:hypothetical protein